jgi:hypothetical protein
MAHNILNPKIMNIWPCGGKGGGGTEMGTKWKVIGRQDLETWAKQIANNRNTCEVLASPSGTAGD